jgi:diguanylate cyclase (GGDEF)-like protein/PAS domain S-box-containing protein
MIDRLEAWFGGSRVVAALLALGLLSLGLLAYFAITLSTVAVQRQAEARLSGASAISATYVQDKMQGLQSLVGLFSQRPELVAQVHDGAAAHYELASIQAQLHQLCGIEQEFGYCFLTDPSGKLVASSPNDSTILGQDFSFRDWYRGAASTGKPYVSEAYVSAFADHPRVVAIAAPVHPRSAPVAPDPNQILAIVVATVSLDQIEAFTDSFATAQGVTLTVTDPHGTIIARPGTAAGRLTDARSDARVGRALAGQSGMISDGSELSAYAPVQQLGWAVVASVPLAAALGGVDQMRNAVMGIGVGLALVFIAGAFVIYLAQRSRRRIERLFGLSIDMLLVAGFDGYFKQVNASWERTLGWTARELCERPYLEFIHPDDQPATANEAQDNAAGTTTAHFENRYRHKDGSYRWLAWTAVPVPKERLIYAVARDVTVAKAADAELRRSRERIRAILDNVADGIVTCTVEGVIESANPNVQAIFGYTATELAGRPVSVLIDDAYQGDFAGRLRNYLRPDKPGVASGSHETMGRRKDGTTFPLEFVASQMVLGSDRIFIGTLRDITERKAERDAMEIRLVQDALTGLPNRTLFADRLRQALLTGQREKTPRSLLIMDLNRFKEVNDTFGHVRGDHVLQEVASRLRAVVRQVDTVARLGGDEFAIVCTQAADSHVAVEIARKVLLAFDPPFAAGGPPVDLGASIGIATYPQHGTDADTLLRHAEVAMYVAKREQLGSAVYAPDQDDNRADRLELRGEVRFALAHDELVLHYQPIINLKTGATDIAEALIRWQHPKHGLLPPGRFMPFVDGTELVTPLTQWVLRQALTEARAWQDAGAPLDIAVNLSALSLQDPDFVATVTDLVRSTGLPPIRLQLEITESTIMTARSDGALQELAALGVRFSIDDFGTGYSSLSYLSRLPVDIIKIDKSFVTDMNENSTNEAIVRSILQLSHSLGCRVVAEGVETVEVLEGLRQMGCDFAQGFYFSRAVPAPEFSAWVKAHPGAGRAGEPPSKAA